MTFNLSWLAVLACIAIPTLGYPTNVTLESNQLVRRGPPGQPFSCKQSNGISGAPGRKLALKNAGAGPIDMAIAMAENNCWFDATQWPAGNYKQGNSMECGAYRNNLGMTKKYCGLDDCEAIQTNVDLATECQRKIFKATYGTNNPGSLDCDNSFWSLQRDGQVDSSYGPQYCGWIQGYFDFIKSDMAHMTDDMDVYWDEPSM